MPFFFFEKVRGKRLRPLDRGWKVSYNILNP